jgi:Tripartite tricarboxylate transporter TctB family
MASSRTIIELLISVLIVFFFVWVLWEARNWPAQSKLFPWSLGLSSLGLALIQVVVAWRAAVRESAAQPDAKTATDDANAATSPDSGPFVSEASTIPARWRAVTICGWVVGFFLGIWLLGFKVGSLCLTFLFLKVTANEKWTISAAIAVGSYLFFWLVFDVALGVPLDNGFIGEYFGWH